MRFADFSAFTLASSLVIAFYRSYIHEPIPYIHTGDSSIWLGDPDALPNRSLARIDLERARLDVAHSSDLLSLGFMFSGLFLVLDRAGIRIESGAALCSVESRAANPARSADQPDLTDTRPVLVIEFPPQHIFEQALFRPGLPGFPDVELTKDGTTAETPDSFDIPQDQFSKLGKQEVECSGDTLSFPTRPDRLLEKLELLSQTEDRARVRREYAERKIKREETDTPDKDYRFFSKFADKFRTRFNSTFGDQPLIAD